jgi:hypothetical protein
MTRILAAIAIIEALVIAVLLFGRGPEPVLPGRDAPRSPAATASDRELERPGAHQASPSPSDSAGETPFKGALLIGRIADTEGNAIEGAGWVTLLPEGGKAYSLRLRKQDRGGFLRAGLAAGRYGLRVTAQGYRPIEDTLEVPDGAAIVRCDLVLERAIVLAIRFVTPDGDPLPAAINARMKGKPWLAHALLRTLTAVATKAAPGPRLPPSLSSAWSRYGVGEYRSAELDGMEPEKDDRHGTLEIRGPLPAHVSACVRSEVLATARLDAPTGKLDLVVDPDRIIGILSGVTFRVLTENGAPPKSVSADLSDLQTMGFGPAGMDAEGRVTFDGRPPGEMQLTVSAPNTEGFYRVVNLPPGEILDLGIIRLGRVVPLPGRVLDPEGKPVKGARISWTDSDRGWEKQRARMVFHQTDDDGRFTLPLGPRRYRLCFAIRDGITWFENVDLTGAVPEDFTVRLGPGAPLRIEFADDVAFPMTLRLLDAGGHRIYGRTFTGAWPVSRILARGTYELVIRPGTDGEERRRIDLTSAEGATVTVDGR